MTGPWSSTVDRDDGIDDENYHRREIYAQFGLAVYLAQVLEHGVVNMLSVTHIRQEATSLLDYDERVSAVLRRTFGALITRLGSVLDGDPQLVDDLTAALDKRNYVVHRFWRERVQLTQTVQGRNRLLGELQDLQALFASVDQRLDRVVFTYSEANGVTRQKVEEFMRRDQETVGALGGYLPSELPILGKNGAK